MKETTFDEQSSLKIYSLGIVVKSENAKKNDGVIMVSPVESMNIQTPGVILNNHNKFQGGHKNEKGVATKADVTAESYVKAQWISLGSSNRASPPDVYPNETVLLFRYGNHDVFYWTCIFHEPHLRKKEIASYAFSNLSNGKGWSEKGEAVAFDKGSSYWFEVDSFKKLVSFTTPDNDGEFSKFSITIDTDKGIFKVEDNKKNSFIIDSRKGIEVNTDKDVSISATGSITLSSKKSISLSAPSSSSKGNFSITGNLDVKGDIRVTGTVYCKEVVTSGGGGGAGAGAGGSAPPGVSDRDAYDSAVSTSNSQGTSDSANDQSAVSYDSTGRRTETKTVTYKVNETGNGLAIDTINGVKMPDGYTELPTPKPADPVVDTDRPSLLFLQAILGNGSSSSPPVTDAVTTFVQGGGLYK